MSYEKFIPTVWAEGIGRELERTMVFAEDCNREYEGDVKQFGDSVRILGVGKPTVTRTTDKKIVLDSPEEIETADVNMNIRQIAHYNYGIGDIDKAQAKESLAAALKAETSEALGNVMDQFIAKLALAPNAVSLEKAPALVTQDSILEMIDRAQQKLWENDVKQSTKLVLTVPPRFYMLLRRAYEKLDTSNSAMLKNGRVGMYGSIEVKLSNNVASSQSKAVDHIMLRTARAIAFANPLTHVEAYRPERSFEDAIKGFVLFDGKIVRPKEMLVIPAKYA